MNPNPSEPSHPPRKTPGLPSESLLPLWRRIKGEFLRRSQKWPLPYSVSFILVGLHVHPELSEPSVIAKTNYLARQTTTFVLDTLEKKKLAVRKSHPSDRRRKIVQLTAKGRTLAAAMLQDVILFEAQALKALNARDLATAKRVLLQYADELALTNERESRL